MLIDATKFNGHMRRLIVSLENSSIKPSVMGVESMLMRLGAFSALLALSRGIDGRITDDGAKSQCLKHRRQLMMLRGRVNNK